MNKEFTKDDLKCGQVVKFRNEMLGMVMNYDNNGFIVSPKIGNMPIKEFNSKLENMYDGNDRSDIIEIYDNSDTTQIFDISTEGRTLLWERYEKVEMTMEEICEELGKQVKIVEKH